MCPDQENYQEDTSAYLSKEEIQFIHCWIPNMKSRLFNIGFSRKWNVQDSLKFNYQILGNGLNRVVFDLNNGYVLKVAISDLGIISNKNEYNLYTTCHPNIKKYLCPVVEIGNGWIIMKKMNQNVTNVMADYYKIAELHYKFISHGIIPFDLRTANVALSEENIMTVIDYGLFVKISKVLNPDKRGNP